MTLIYYPIQDYGPLMKGMVIGGLGIFHVFLAQMAIGGGMLLCYFELLRAGAGAGTPGGSSTAIFRRWFWSALCWVP